MVACTFCGSKNIRSSGSSTLDTTVTRVLRILTFQRLYRCRSCDALFEAMWGGGRVNSHDATSREKSWRKSPASVDSHIEPLKTAIGN
jgi:hypothetical protein